MQRKLLALILASLLSTLGLTVQAQTNTKDSKDSKRAKKVKGLILQAGVGHDANVEIKLKDKTELKGFVSEVTQDQFVIVDKTTGAQTRLSYDQVEKVRLWPLVKNNIRRDLSSPAGMFKKIAIGAGLFIGVAAMVCVVSRRCAE